MKPLLTYLTEAIANKNFSRAQAIIAQYFKKYKIYTMPDISNVTIEGVKYFGNFVFDSAKNTGAYFLWKQTSSTKLDGIVFTSDASKYIFAMQEGKRVNGDVELSVRDASLAAVLPLVRKVLKGEIKMNAKTIDGEIDEYQMFESLNESAEIDDLIKRRNNLSVKLSQARKAGKDTLDLEAEYEDIKRQISKLRHVAIDDVNVEIAADPVDAQENEFIRRSTPEERFKDMEHYINMVLSGVQPSLIISGAPGVGKTYRVTRKIKANHTLGTDYWVIKGKCTPAALYMDLFKYRHEGDVLVIDDADDILKDETSINILKAATDSSDERVISYGSARAPQMSPEEAADEPDAVLDEKGRPFYPKTFITRASVIVITNMNAGAIDTAVKNRALVCDLSFTTEELLGIVKEIMPAIMPNVLSVESKIKAMDYLNELCARGSNMEISIRSFTTVAKIYTACEGDDESAERMIREQMSLQFSRNKKHY